MSKVVNKPVHQLSGTKPANGTGHSDSASSSKNASNSQLPTAQSSVATQGSGSGNTLPLVGSLLLYSLVYLCFLTEQLVCKDC